MADQDFTPEELAGEEWRPVAVAGFEAHYSVSNLGRVRRDAAGSNNAKPGRILRRGKARGYARIALCVGGVPRKTSVHFLVATAFLGPTPPGCTVDHRDGVKVNNRVGNLRFLTPKRQMQEASRLGLVTRGATHPNAVLTEDLVRTMRLMRAGGALLKEIAAIGGCDLSTAHRVVTNRTWRHVP